MYDNSLEVGLYHCIALKAGLQYYNTVVLCNNLKFWKWDCGNTTFLMPGWCVATSILVNDPMMQINRNVLWRGGMIGAYS